MLGSGLLVVVGSARCSQRMRSSTNKQQAHNIPPRQIPQLYNPRPNNEIHLTKKSVSRPYACAWEGIDRLTEMM